MKLALHTSSNDSKIGLLSGLIGGVGKYFLEIQTPFIINLMGAVFTAFICGLAGVAGKELYTFIKTKIKSKK